MSSKDPTEPQKREIDPKLEAARRALQVELQEVLAKHALLICEHTNTPGDILLQEAGRLGGSTMFNVFASVVEDREKLGFKSDNDLIKWLFDTVAQQTMFAFMACVEGDAIPVEEQPQLKH